MRSMPWHRCEGFSGLLCSRSSHLPARLPAQYHHLGEPRSPAYRGRDQGLPIDPKNTDRFYAVSSNGGIWKLENFAHYPDGPDGTWQPLTDHLLNLRFRRIGIAPSDPNIIYAANSVKELWVNRDPHPPDTHSEIFQSDHMGEGWFRIDNGKPIGDHEFMGVVNRIVVDKNDARSLLVATSTGLWKRNGANGAWTNLRAGNCLDVKVDPSDSQIIYLGINGSGVFKSTDGGTFPAAPIVAPNPAVTLGRDSNGVPIPNFGTIDIALGQNRLNQEGALIAETPKDRTVVVKFGGEARVSQDGGATFSNTPAPVFSVGPGNAQIFIVGAGGQVRSDIAPRPGGDWASSLAINPRNSQEILVGGTAVFRSVDGGATWTNPFIDHEDHHCLVFGLGNNQRNLVFDGNDGGLLVSADSGASWPTRGLSQTIPSRDAQGVLTQGLNLAVGLSCTEFRHMAVHGGRCMAVIDHLGFAYSGDLSNRWQFVFDSPDGSKRHGDESSYVFACPSSVDRWYVVSIRDGYYHFDASLKLHSFLAQWDLKYDVNGFAKPPIDVNAKPKQFFQNLSDRQMSLLLNGASGFDSPLRDLGAFFPEETVFNRNVRGPVAVRLFDNGNRLVIFGSVTPDLQTHRVISLRMGPAGTDVSEERVELELAATGVENRETISVLCFMPQTLIAYAGTVGGRLFRRDFADPNGTFVEVAAPGWALSPNSIRTFNGERLSLLVPVPMRNGKNLVYLLSQQRIAKFEEGGLAIGDVFTWPDISERLISMAADPGCPNVLYLGTTRGVYVSNDSGEHWSPYGPGFPKVPVTELIFDQSHLYAGTFGRGLWRCTP